MATVAELMKRPYHIEMFRDTDGKDYEGWFVRVRELPGCISQGDTPAEAGEMIDEAMQLWLESMLEHGHPIPAPESEPVEPVYSGKFQLRVTSTLHGALVHAAEREGTSLNLFCATTLGRAVGRLDGSAPGTTRTRRDPDGTKPDARTRTSVRRHSAAGR
jgi:predicted RNase H-like HicB family nuclease